MLRAGPLSSAPVLERLKHDFVTCWTLKKDLERIGSSDSPYASLALDVAEAYTYPVDSLVLSSGGEILKQLAVNDDPSDEGYWRLLKAADG